MLNNVGTKELRTPRLLLRKIKESDYKDMFSLTTKEEVARYVSWSPHKSLEDTKKLCQTWANQYSRNDRYNWAIVYNNKVIGNIDVIKIFDTTAFLGWQIDSPYWNKGITTEAANAICDFLYNQVKIKKIEACYMEKNIASGRVMEKIGMKRVPKEKYTDTLFYMFKGTTRINGHSLICYQMKKDEWETFNSQY